MVSRWQRVAPRPGAQPFAAVPRLFLALPIGTEARGELGAFAARELAAGLRLVPEDNLHVTLVFCGAVPEERLPEVTAALVLVPPGFAFTLAPRRLRAYGSAVGVALEADPATVALQAALASRLVDGGLAQEERRPWSPHVTVARGPYRRRPRVPDVEPPAMVLRGSAVVVYASVATGRGVRYEPLSSSSSSAT
jgi:2'-5' RNA ligase